jgi:hypothetical protein
MASSAAVIAPVDLVIVLFCLCDRWLAARELSEIYPVLRGREEGAAWNMNLMIPVGLCVLVYVIT